MILVDYTEKRNKDGVYPDSVKSILPKFHILFRANGGHLHGSHNKEVLKKQGVSLLSGPVTAVFKVSCG